MRISSHADRGRLVDAAAGRIPCDLRIVNCRLANVITGEVYPAEVSLFQQWIASVDEPGSCALPAPAQIFDAEGAYLIPGFIDTHIHVESTMLTPSHFAEAVLPWGTTTVVTDPHEIANVLGTEGVLHMAEDASSMPLRHFILAPSCVPANPALETGGAVLTPQDIRLLLEHPNILGLGEVMDFDGVCRNEPRMREELRCGLDKDLFLQGHAPRLEGPALASYLCAGIDSDHECRSGEECLNKLRLGMHVNLKSTSLSNHLAQTLEGIRDVPWRDRISLCTDDVHAQTILTRGHLNRVVGEAIGHGLPALEAIRFATLHAAREYGFRDLGAIAPGFLADIQLVRELDGGQPEHVFLGGQLAASHGQCLFSPPEQAAGLFPQVEIHMEQLRRPGALGIAAETAGGGVPGISAGADPGSASGIAAETDNDSACIFVLQYKENGGPFNGGRYERLPVSQGFVDFSGDEELCRMCVCNRYGSGEKAVAPMRGSGLLRGAYAFTVSHDSHNLVILYHDEADALLAAERIREMGGGYAAACGGKILADLALPVGGIMSRHPVQKLAEEIHHFEQAAAELFAFPGNLLRFATSSLSVLPGYILTDRGIVDGKLQKFVDEQQSNTPQQADGASI
ncbi:MAG: adenine deaminase [Ruminococcus sp.]|uniref:Adenine deaminase n=1 Tax=Schaedlerella arabinosiphila TaxID=2044587 RepID=A0A3R8JS39_9FIRM|nr:adenine deaminase C-terminal domain-containing protein [Schaedlerella arabinosiphila]MCI8724076.1 adenine deaminase [Ruminococcus sp.]RRK33840.1 adenine deaminase [Schaedlerella arabinosiphila]